MGYRERDQVVTTIICGMALEAGMSLLAMLVADVRRGWLSAPPPARKSTASFPGK
ncbi:MAG TPA: hypothetical protein VGG64_08780 [Pirellulales bacterium]